MANENDELVAKLKSVLLEDARAFWRKLPEDAPGESVYAFVYQGPVAHAATAESLTRVVEEYKENGYAASAGDTDSLLSAMLRWDPISFCFGAEVSEERAEMLNKEFGSLLREQPELLEATCVDVLKEMDAAGEFGSGSEREKIVLGVFLISGDMDRFILTAEKLNAPHVVERLKGEFAAGQAANGAFESPWKDH